MAENHKTSFATKVYSALQRIPAGRVATYGQLAAWIGCGSPRAVGGALARNPDAPEVPCHRVVRRDGGLGGYQGAEEGAALERKRGLLEREGVRFLPGGKVDLERCGVSEPIDRNA